MNNLLILLEFARLFFIRITCDPWKILFLMIAIITWLDYEGDLMYSLHETCRFIGNLIIVISIISFVLAGIMWIQIPDKE